MDEAKLISIVETVVEDSDDCVAVEDVYVVGSRGARSGNPTEDSDLDVLVSLRSKGGFRGEELFLVCDEVESVLWNEKFELVLKSSGLDVPHKKRFFDVGVYPVFAIPVELSRRVNIGGYETVYSLVQGRYMTPEGKC